MLILSVPSPAAPQQPQLFWFFLNTTDTLTNSTTLLLRSHPAQPSLPLVNDHLKAARALAGSAASWRIERSSIEVVDGGGARVAYGEGNFGALAADKAGAQVLLAREFQNAPVDTNLTVQSVIPTFPSVMPDVPPPPQGSRSAAPAASRTPPPAQPTYTDGTEGPVSLPLIFSVAALIACLTVTAGILYQRHRASQRAISYADLRRDGL